VRPRWRRGSHCIQQFVESGVLDADKLDQILKRHGLLEKWEHFGVKFLRGPDPSG